MAAGSAPPSTSSIIVNLWRLDEPPAIGARVKVVDMDGERYCSDALLGVDAICDEVRRQIDAIRMVW